MIDKIHYGNTGKPDLIKRNPTKPCPDSPNCVRLSMDYDLDLNELKTCVEITLKMMGAKDLVSDYEKNFFSGVFQVFIFKDDMTVYCEDYNSHSLLHLKSASRVGYGDLGVNKRRVKKFLQKLALMIEERQKH